MRLPGQAVVGDLESPQSLELVALKLLAPAESPGPTSKRLPAKLEALRRERPEPLQWRRVDVVLLGRLRFVGRTDLDVPAAFALSGSWPVVAALFVEEPVAVGLVVARLPVVELGQLVFGVVLLLLVEQHQNPCFERAKPTCRARRDKRVGPADWSCDVVLVQPVSGRDR